MGRQCFSVLEINFILIGERFRRERTRYSEDIEERRTVELSEREKQIVELASEGHTDTSIAHELGISEATVSTYWSRVRMKIGPYSRPELVARIIRTSCSETIVELREQNKQLIVQLERDTGKEWGREGANFYRDLLEQAPDAILVVNEDGDIETSNEEAAKLFGYGRTELEGMSLSHLMPERYRRIHDDHRREFLASPARRPMAEHSVSLALDASGREFSIAATLSPIITVTGTHVMCIVREVPKGTYSHAAEASQANAD